jgi:hypothetical protein
MITDHPDYVDVKAWFPADTAMKSLTVNNMEAKATQPIDQQNIRQWMGTKAEEVNLALLKRYFPAAFLAVFIDTDVHKLRDFVEEYASFLSQQTLVVDTIHSLDLVVKLTESNDDAVAALCLHYLVQLGCDANRPSKGLPGLGYPLRISPRNEMYDCCCRLLEARADPNNLSLSLLRLNMPDDIEDVLQQGGAMCKVKCSQYCCPLAYCVGLCQL